jgi:hypothetical protein
MDRNADRLIKPRAAALVVNDDRIGQGRPGSGSGSAVNLCCECP